MSCGRGRYEAEAVAHPREADLHELAGGWFRFRFECDLQRCPLSYAVGKSQIALSLLR